MIERLQRALEHVEELTEPLGDLPALNDRAAGDTLPQTVCDALALAGAWSDLQGDDEFEAMDRIRHDSKPSPPMDEQLAWLDDECA